MDAYVDSAAANRAQILYTLGSAPPWASSRPQESGPYGPGSAAPPARLGDWEDYVLRVAHRYRGRIQAYELWNEPFFSDVVRDRDHRGFFSGSVAQMVELAASARRVLDRVDPAALLTTPGFVNGPDRLALFLASGGAPLVAAVAYHFYSRDSVQFVRQVTDVRQVMAYRGVAKLPLWNTECGVESNAAADSLPPGISRRLTVAEAAAMMAQFLVLGAALGLARFDYYAWDNERSGLVDGSGAPTLRQRAWSRLTHWTLGARLGPPTFFGASGVFVPCERSGARFLLAWSDQAHPEALHIPPGWRIEATQALLDGSVTRFAAGATRSLPIALSLAPVRVALVPA